jgi:hypothetical protein
VNFEELNNHIPYVIRGKVKSLTLEPYPGITIAMPGKHALETIPKGGDFVVMVTDAAVGWENHPFSHVDIFQDVQTKHPKGLVDSILMNHYYSIIHHNIDAQANSWYKPVGITPHIFLRAVQCLAVAEHRRYSQYEAKLGGKYLPFRYAAGIAEGLWTAADAATKQKLGRPGVEWLEKDNGIPHMTQRLMFDVGMIDKIEPLTKELMD